MKTRNGWVSNSSSSSFVMFATKEAVDNVLATCSEMERKIAECFLNKTDSFLGKEMMSYSYNSGNNGDYDMEQVQEVFSEFVDIDEDSEDYNEKYEDAEQEAYDFAFGSFECKVREEADKLGQGTLSMSMDS